MIYLSDLQDEESPGVRDPKFDVGMNSEEYLTGRKEDYSYDSDVIGERVLIS